MKTTETIVDKNYSPKISESVISNGNARPLQSLRPMKSMVRVKSLRPKKVEISKSRRKAVKY